MNYLSSILRDCIKDAFERDNAVGVSIVLSRNVCSPQQMTDVIAEYADGSDFYLVLDGVDLSAIRHPDNVHVSNAVEKAVNLRNHSDAQGRIVFGCEQLKKRSASLQLFSKIDARALAVAIADDKKINAPNVPVATFWDGLSKFIRDDGVPPLNGLLAFLNEIDGDSDRIERSLWTLQLVPDSRILSNKINVSDRIRLNRDVVEQLGSMDDSVRKKMTASLKHFSADEKSTYRKLLQFFRDGEFECLKGLDLDSVISIITKTKTSSGTPPADPGSNPSGDESAPGKLPNPTSVLRDALDGMLSGDETSKDRLEDFGSDLIKFVEEHEDPFEDTTSEDQPTIEDLKSGSTIAFPLVRIDRNLYKLVRRCTSEETWGGVVLGEYSNLHPDTICPLRRPHQSVLCKGSKSQYHSSADRRRTQKTRSRINASVKICKSGGIAKGCDVVHRRISSLRTSCGFCFLSRRSDNNQ